MGIIKEQSEKFWNGEITVAQQHPLIPTGEYEEVAAGVMFYRWFANFTAIKTGVCYLAVALTAVVASGIAQGLVTRIGVKPALLFGLAMVGGGLVYFTQLSANGSYFGLHQWYFEVSSCPLNPTLGPTAFRVLEASGGVRYLRVCLSSPGGSQPTITADGGSNGATYGCVDSARVGALPSSQVLSLKQLVSLPSARKCVSRRAFAVHVRDPAHDPFKTISISIAGHRLNVVRHGVFNVAMVNLKGLPRGTFTLEVRGRTVLGRRLSGQRSYHTCVKRRVSRTRSRRR